MSACQVGASPELAPAEPEGVASLVLPHAASSSGVASSASEQHGRAFKVRNKYAQAARGARAHDCQAGVTALRCRSRMQKTILEGARTHNLQGVDVSLEPGQVVAITGVSGAGKSSLALDTLYAEGQRRFVESFSPYARQFLELLERSPTTRLEPGPARTSVHRRAP